MSTGSGGGGGGVAAARVGAGAVRVLEGRQGDDAGGRALGRRQLVVPGAVVVVGLGGRVLMVAVVGLLGVVPRRPVLAPQVSRLSRVARLGRVSLSRVDVRATCGAAGCGRASCGRRGGSPGSRTSRGVSCRRLVGSTTSLVVGCHSPRQAYGGRHCDCVCWRAPVVGTVGSLGRRRRGRRDCRASWARDGTVLAALADTPL